MKIKSHYEILYSIAKEIASSMTPDEVLNTIVESVPRSINAKGCSLMLLTPDRKELIHNISYGLSKRYLKKGAVKTDTSINEVLSGNPVVILDATQDERIQYKEQTKKEGIASVLSIPLMPHGEVLGIMRVYTSEKREFSPEDIDFLGCVANLGAIAMRRATLHEDLGRILEQRSTEVAKLEEEKTSFLRFLGIAAHDLKAPLTAIQGFLWIMLGGYAGELNEKQRNMLERSTRRINELLILISDLLDIPRSEAGQILEEIKEISLREVVKHSIDIQRNWAKEKGIKLKVEFPKHLPKIYGSSLRLQQVLTNLVGNAISYTLEGLVTVRVTECNKELQVEVIDSGIGITSKDLPHIFEEFFRGSNVEIKGTGLGLSIAKRIVEAHGGIIWAESPCVETGVGSKFIFTLPKKSCKYKVG